MGKVTCDIAMSIDGFVAGPNQSVENPLGEGVGDQLHQWIFAGAEADAEAIAGITAARAYIMGRNMFGPGRGSWDDSWRGWWGEDPPCHAPVFVLTHQPREPLTMQGGTNFTFVTDGVEAALEQAHTAAAGADVAIAGGAATVRSYIRAGLLEELRLHLVPALIGAGERLLDDLEGVSFEQVHSYGTDAVTHLRYRVGKPS